ncbi:hypothetical protein TCAL_14721 [Tigriopus californicus]|uniref:Uncharacterized protein n=1 Tax=Tigriopus californicus TaxID=6832 RepID=A0A553PGS1_TIGCA|nr:hypothetical protein TCAL_14721 [Tigriopus californicus]
MATVNGAESDIASKVPLKDAPPVTFSKSDIPSNPTAAHEFVKDKITPFIAATGDQDPAEQEANRLLTLCAFEDAPPVTFSKSDIPSNPTAAHEFVKDKITPFIAATGDQDPAEQEANKIADSLSVIFQDDQVDLSAPITLKSDPQNKIIMATDAPPVTFSKSDIPSNPTVAHEFVKDKITPFIAATGDQDPAEQEANKIADSLSVIFQDDQDDQVDLSAPITLKSDPQNKIIMATVNGAESDIASKVPLKDAPPVTFSKSDIPSNPTAAHEFVKDKITPFIAATGDQDPAEQEANKIADSLSVIFQDDQVDLSAPITLKSDPQNKIIMATVNGAESDIASKVPLKDAPPVTFSKSDIPSNPTAAHEFVKDKTHPSLPPQEIKIQQSKRPTRLLTLCAFEGCSSSDLFQERHSSNPTAAHEFVKDKITPFIAATGDQDPAEQEANKIADSLSVIFQDDQVDLSAPITLKSDPQNKIIMATVNGAESDIASKVPLKDAPPVTFSKSDIPSNPTAAHEFVLCSISKSGIDYEHSFFYKTELSSVSNTPSEPVTSQSIIGRIRDIVLVLGPFNPALLDRFGGVNPKLPSLSNREAYDPFGILDMVPQVEFGTPVDFGNIHPIQFKPEDAIQPITTGESNLPTTKFQNDFQETTLPPDEEARLSNILDILLNEKGIDYINAVPDDDDQSFDNNLNILFSRESAADIVNATVVEDFDYARRIRDAKNAISFATISSIIIGAISLLLIGLVLFMIIARKRRRSYSTTTPTQSRTTITGTPIIVDSPSVSDMFNSGPQSVENPEPVMPIDGHQTIVTSYEEFMFSGGAKGNILSSLHHATDSGPSSLESEHRVPPTQDLKDGGDYLFARSRP